MAVVRLMLSHDCARSLQEDRCERSVDLNEATREVIALSLSDSEKPGDRAGEPCRRPPAVIGDRVQLQQVMMNLFLNASDAMSDVEDRSTAVGDQNRTRRRRSPSV